MTFKILKQNYIKNLLDTKAILIKSIDETPFTLRSGKQSYMFFDHSKLASSATGYKALIDAVAFQMDDIYGNKEFALCNVDSKLSAQMAGSLAYILNKPQFIYKSQTLIAVEKGTQRQFTGNTEWKLPVAIPDDVSTGGDGTAKGVGDLLKESFPNVTDVQIFVGFIRHVKPSTYKTHYLLTLDELIDIVWNKLSAGQKEAVKKERAS